MGGGYLPEVTPSQAPVAPPADQKPLSSTGGKPPPAGAGKGAAPPPKRFGNLAGLPQVRVRRAQTRMLLQLKATEGSTRPSPWVTAAERVIFPGNRLLEVEVGQNMDETARDVVVARESGSDRCGFGCANVK